MILLSYSWKIYNIYLLSFNRNKPINTDPNCSQLKDKDKTFSCSLEPGLSENDRYLTSAIGGLVTSVMSEKDGQEGKSKEDDYSGAKKAVITEKVSI